MQWFRAHPYTTVAAIAIIIILIGALFIRGRSTVPPSPSSTTAWGGSSGFLYSSLEGARADGGQLTLGLYRDVQNTPPFLYIPPTQNTLGGTPANGFDFEAFLSQLSREKEGRNVETPAENSLLSDVYSYIPTSFIATSAPEKERTETQEALYKYGNEAGLYIQLFEDRNSSMARVLKDQFEDPNNTEKTAALIGLGESMTNIGRLLEAIENVPIQAKAANIRLAKSYQFMGAKLALVPAAGTDEEKIAVMLAYNATAEEFIKNYISLVTIFSISGVTFSQSDPGSVFTFTASGL